MPSLKNQIEALLFWKGEPVSVADLARMTKKSAAEIEIALTELEASLNGRGIVMMRTNDEILLGTHPSLSDLIETLRKEELEKDIGKAGLETLTTILYRGPITRAEIDYIRGVNSTFILRNLLVRGLIERIQNPNDQRSFVYRPTFDLLSFLGIRNVTELPEYADVQAAMKAFESTKTETEPEQPSTQSPE